MYSIPFINMQHTKDSIQNKYSQVFYFASCILHPAYFLNKAVQNNGRIILTILIVSFTLSSCKTQQRNTASSKQSTLTESDRVESQYLFYNAVKEKMLGNYDKASSLFTQCLRIDDRNDAACYELAQMFDKSGKYAEALVFARRASDLNPKNTWYQKLYADLLQKNKHYDEAVKVYDKLIREHPDQIEYYMEKAAALLYAGKGNDAIKVYEKLEDMIGLNPEIVVQKEQVYLRMNKLDKAIAEVQRLIDAFPKEVRYYGMMAELYQANGLKDKALETFNKILELEPDNAQVHLSLAEFYRSIGEKEKSFSELKIAFSNKDLDIEPKLQVLTSYYLLIARFPELKEQALELNRVLVDTHPGESRVHAIYGDFLFQEKKFEEARYQYRAASKNDKQNYLLWQQLLLVESQLSDYHAMLTESEEALTLFPAQPFVYLFNGIAKIQTQKYESAIEVLKAGSKLVVDNKPMLVQFYSNLADTYFRLKMNRESDSAFNKALDLDPRNTTVLNNYSYYLSLRGDSLDKAEAMALLTNTLEPNSPAYQDTYGWVLYKRKKYHEAKEWIEKAMQNGGSTDADILEHYGDILFKMGNSEQALEYWEKAKKSGAASEQLLKKIADKKLYD